MSQIKVIGNAALLFGTVDIAGKTYGECESANIELTGDEEGVPDDMGGFQAFILANDTYKVSMTCIIPSTAVLPSRADQVDIGYINLACTVMSWRIVAEKGKSRKIEMTLSHWVSIGGVFGVGAPVTTLPAVPSAPPAED